MAKKSMGVPRDPTRRPARPEFWLLETIRKYSAEAGIKMPEVGIYEGAPT